MFSEEKVLAEKLKKVLSDGNSTPLFIYNGVYNYSLLNSQLTTLRSYLEAQGLEMKTLRRVYSTLIEGIENIYRHSFVFTKENSTELNYAYVVLAHKKDFFTVRMGNFIDNKQVSVIKKAIDGSILIGENDLREEHSYKLINNKLSEKEGAGVGIIDIALMSKSPIKYEIESYKKDVSFLSLEIDFK